MGAVLCPKDFEESIVAGLAVLVNREGVSSSFIISTTKLDDLDLTLFEPDNKDEDNAEEEDKELFPSCGVSAVASASASPSGFPFTSWPEIISNELDLLLLRLLVFRSGLALIPPLPPPASTENRRPRWTSGLNRCCRKM